MDVFEYLFPSFEVKVVGKKPSSAYYGISHYCVETSNKERYILHYDDTYAEIGDVVRIRNYWLFYG